MGEPEVERVAVALVGRAAEFARVEPQADALDLEHDLLGGEGLDVGGRVLDSLELSEWIFALEDELGVVLTELDHVDRVRTLRRLATYLRETVDPAVLAEFTERWARWHDEARTA